MSLLNHKLSYYQDEIDKALIQYLPNKSEKPTRLIEALHYVVFNGGKRIRPTLIYATGETFGTSLEELHPAAVAIELIHAYSLTHDDLPAMDDDDLRRGKKTCHREFDEATAILTGDALLTLAFDVLSSSEIAQKNSKATLKMISMLSAASGWNGMVGGQAIDLYAVGQNIDLQALKSMHAKKTGALINASVLLGALSSQSPSQDQVNSLSNYADCIGLSFQIRDDILDVEGKTEVIGKSQGSDASLNKPTYAKLLGLEGAKKAANDLHNEAINHLAMFDQRADVLRELSYFIVQREK